MARTEIIDKIKDFCYNRMVDNYGCFDLDDSINSAIDEEVAAATANKLVLNKHDCKTDAERPEEYYETVLVVYEGNFFFGTYITWLDGKELWNLQQASFLPFEDADYWCRLEGAK
jgi:hypothetical protein